MGTGAITGYIDVAQVALYAFWIFFFDRPNCSGRSKHCPHLMLGDNTPEGRGIWRANRLTFK